MGTDVENVNEDQDLVHLSAKNFTVKISRSILKSSSFFFKAAFKSGMAETQSGKFSLPDFSDRQLQHLCNFLSDFDILTAKLAPTNDLANKNSVPTAPSQFNCLQEENMRRIVESTLVADYLQMPSFKEKLVDFFSTLLHSTYTPSTSSCLSAGHTCNIFTYSFPILSDSRLHCLRKTLLNFLFRFPLTYLSPKYVNVDICQSFVANIISRWLSDDRIFFGSEDGVLNTISDWIQLPHQLKKARLSADSTFNVLSVLSNAIRPGLLSPYGLRYFLSLLCDDSNPFDTDLNSKLSSIRILLSHDFKSPFQTLLCSSLCRAQLVSSLGTDAFKPRASSPILVILSKPTSSSSDFVLYFIELVHGIMLTTELPSSLKSSLIADPIESNPIHVCTAEVKSCQNLVFICIHNINTGTVKSFIWDLSTLKAEWLPTLDLKHNSFSWAAEQLPTTFSLPHAVGMVYTSDGLMLFCSFVLASDAVLCVYRFDARSWSWVKYTPHKFDLNLRLPGLKGFTPMPKATRRGDRWLYGTLDLSTGSEFVRARPSQFDEDNIEVERLPSPSFLVRAYCLVGVDMPGENSEHAKSYILPFHACSRDNLALNTCFCLESGSWRNWDPIDSRTSSSINFGFSRRHVGFRGVVCTSSLTFRPSAPPNDLKQSFDGLSEITNGSCSSSTTFISASSENFESHPLIPPSPSSSSSSCTDISHDFELCSSPLPPSDPDLPHDDSLLLTSGAYLVLAGRLAQSVDVPEPRSSGIWLVDPSRPTTRPTFLLSCQLDSLLYHLDGSVATVALANWSALTQAVSSLDQSTPVMHFPASITNVHLGQTAYCSMLLPSGAGSDSD